MAYNLARTRSRVLNDKLDDDEFDGQIVDNFINDTQRDIYNQFELPFQEKIFQGTIPAGSTMLALPDDLALLQSQTLSGVQNFSARKMAWRDFFRLYPDNAAAEPGEPEAWTLYAGNIIFSRPMPEDHSLTSFYIKKPITLEDDSDVPDIPYEFEELLVLGAFRRVLDRNEDYDLSGIVETQYQAQLALLVNRYGFREADGPIKIKNKQTR